MTRALGRVAESLPILAITLAVAVAPGERYPGTSCGCLVRIAPDTTGRVSIVTAMH